MLGRSTAIYLQTVTHVKSLDTGTKSIHRPADPVVTRCYRHCSLGILNRRARKKTGLTVHRKKSILRRPVRYD